MSEFGDAVRQRVREHDYPAEAILCAPCVTQFFLAWKADPREELNPLPDIQLADVLYGGMGMCLDHVMLEARPANLILPSQQQAVPPMGGR
jgi:hypothetical protein